MCTVSLIPHPSSPSALRLVCNRDERRTRAAAQPPTMHTLGQRRAIHPIDRQAGGTWIAVNDAGLLLVLLNRTPPLTTPANHAPPAATRISRGRIIPQLLHCDQIAQVHTLAQRLPLSDYPPFMLLLISRGQGIALDSDGHKLTLDAHWHPSQPMFFTTSGLGDALVHQPRHDVFFHLLQTLGLSPAMQDTLHQQTNTQHPELGILMSRDDARTVSRTMVELLPDQVTMRYQALDEQGQPGNDSTYHHLPLTHVSPTMSPLKLHPAQGARL